MERAMMDVSIRSNLKDVSRTLNAFAQKQVPFASALAATSLAKRVQAEETKAFTRVFDRPTPFTMKAVGVKAARKTDLIATIFVKDIAASYLAPYEFGGVHKLNGQAMLVPKGAATNQYGNLPKNLLARLKGRADIFIGPVKTKKGEIINGVWQRPHIRMFDKIRGKSGLGRGYNTTGQLKLLIRFTDAPEVTKHLNYRARAKLVIATHFNAEFAAAMSKAIASATH